ncbi:putative ATP-dependent RNA helicase DHX57 [Littorina saxatilis]|uniref:putative ATP-dependent RNA helicase DHX57 n=1 Tax=Littorina saxatilis TaxID=31220 RepID=UPI0038B4D9FD
MDGPVLDVREASSGRGGRGGGGGRGVLKPTGRPSAHGRGRGQAGGAGYLPTPYSAPATPRAASRESNSKVKVQMQHLHMTSENQEMVRDMLKSLHGDEHSIPSDNEYDELDTRSEDHYWQTDRPLFIDSAHAYAHSNPRPSVIQRPRSDKATAGHSNTHTHSVADSSSNVNPIALNKLQRCGFSHQLCEEALQVCDGDVGASLEYLLTELKTLDLPPDSSTSEEIPEEVAQLRQEEKLAMEAIYEHRFEERIENRVWLLHLDLPELKELLHFQKHEKGEDRKKLELCRFYQKGHCRFGDQCRQLHALPMDMKKQAVQLQGPLAENLFTLEIRFPPGNLYPNDVPLIAFSSVISRMPAHGCLNISRFLMQSAQEYADMQLPAIFSLVSLLEDREQLQTLLDSPPPPLPGSDSEVISAVPSQPKNERPQLHSGEKNGAPGGNSLDKKEATSASSVKDFAGDNKRKDQDVRPSSGKRFHQKGSQESEKDKSVNVLKQNKKLMDDFKKKATLSSYRNRMSDRKKLPAWAEQDHVLASMQGSQVVVISGMTGCGKTTQVPQFIFDQYLQSKDLHLCNIICTQPRRISAIAVAQRVADERAEKLGNSVGYQIRLESVQSAATRLLFCTTGIILRRLEGDPLLSDVTHIIVDEVHERSEDSDFLLMILRDLLPERPDLKIILMSATLNADLFSSYFGYCPVVEIPGRTFPVQPFFLEDAIEMSRHVMEENSPYARSKKKSGGGDDKGGRGGGKKKGTSQSYADAIEESLMGLSLDSWDTGENEPSDKKDDERLNVKELASRYPGYSKLTIRNLALMDLEKINYDLILELLEFIVSGDHEFPRGGAILVFLPGFAEIQQLLDMLLSSSEFGHRNKAKYRIVPLHSTLSSDEQNAVFSKPREGVTKIVIATNIAETSITIDDVVYVVDAGRMKEKRYDSARSMESLETVWVSRANAMQRRGRAGRVKSGVCFHLFTSHRFEHHLRDQPIPEIQRVPLEQLMLRIRMLDLFASDDPRAVLCNVVEPPAMEAMDNAMQRLQDVGALDEEENLTALGYILGSLPVDVRIGKLMVFGAIFRCLDSALTIAASLSFKSPFVSPFGKKTEADEKKHEFAVGNSDYLTILNAYKKWLEAKKLGRHEEYEFCQENFLSIKTLQMLASLKQQYVELLSDIGFTKQGLRLRTVQRAARESWTDGIVEATGADANSNTKNWKLISAILVGALYPNVVQVMTPDKRFSQSTGGAVAKAPNADELRFVTKSDGNVHVHPSSVNFQVRHYENPYLVYHEKVKTSKVYIRDCTMVSVYSLLLFAGNHISIDLDRGKLILSVDDGWIRFQASSGQVAELLKELRVELDQLLEDKIQNPNMDLSNCPRGSRIIDTIVTLITTQ